MQKENVIDFLTYRNEKNTCCNDTHSAISQELETAIQLLITQLKEKGPLQHSR
jgi:hypothetical protein